MDAAIESNQDPGVDARADVLQNHDILAMIFDHIGIDPTSSDQIVFEARKDLLYAAQVCKAFMDPALDSLWRVLPSLVPLLLLLPSFGIVDNVYVLEDLKAGDWHRYDFHARRVRVLYLKPLRMKISPFVYPRIGRHREGPLLPALRELRIPSNGSLDLISAFIISSPHLEVIELNQNAIGDTQFFYPFLSALNQEFPHVQHLILRGNNIVNVKPILQLTEMRKLQMYLPNIYHSTSFMSELGNMENILELTLHVGTAIPNVIPTPLRPDTRVIPRVDRPRKFRGLKSLHLLGVVSAMTRIVEYMDLNSLTTFYLDENPDSTGVPSESFWMQCFDGLASSHSITAIQIDQSPSRDYGHAGYSLSTSMISSLLHLQKLETLVINNASFCGSDNDFSTIASAFPQLRKLVLPDSYHNSCPTFKSLFYFSLTCPKLEELKLCLSLNGDILNTTSIMASEASKLPKKHDHPLRELYISSSFGQLGNEQLFQIGRYLDRAFPNLEVLNAYGQRASYESWNQVRVFQAALQDIRRNA